MKNAFVKIDHELSVTDALEIAYVMLLRIRDGESYPMLEYHDKLKAIENTREQLRNGKWHVIKAVQS